MALMFCSVYETGVNTGIHELTELYFESKHWQVTSVPSRGVSADVPPLAKRIYEESARVSPLLVCFLVYSVLVLCFFS